MGSIVIMIVFMLISWLISSQLKRRFKKYSKIPVSYGMTGKDVAQKMLRDYGIYDVSVTSVKGQLTDHYNPINKTINLSQNVYYSNSVSAAAVAAHETGHAVQHANAYSWLQLRSALVPIQNISSQILNFIFIIMFFGASLIFKFISFDVAILIIIACYTVFTLFAFVTLPVEINASKRALAWLNTSGITTYNNHEQAKDALKWAAYTYVVVALGSLAQLLYWIMIFLARRD